MTMHAVGLVTALLGVTSAASISSPLVRRATYSGVATFNNYAAQSK